MTARIDDYLKKVRLSKSKLDAFNEKTDYKKNQEVSDWQLERKAFLTKQIAKSLLRKTDFEVMKASLILEAESEERNEQIADYEKFIYSLDKYVLKLQSEITWIDANGA